MLAEGCENWLTILGFVVGFIMKISDKTTNKIVSICLIVSVILIIYGFYISFRSSSIPLDTLPINKSIYNQPEAIVNHSSSIEEYSFLEIGYRNHQYISYGRHLIHAQHCQCLTNK